MPSARTTLERIGDRVPVPEPAFERLLRRQDRKRRNQRIGAAAIAAILALVGMSILARSFRGTQPASEPTPAPTPEGIFADVAGWIAFSNDRLNLGPLGIWAVDPMRPNDLEARIQLSDRPGEALAWSSDGSRLLIGRRGPPWRGLFVLEPDATETGVARCSMGRGWRHGCITGGSFSPDGSQVVFATLDAIYTVDADGGTGRTWGGEPRTTQLVLAARSRTDVFNPAFSPDGTQIAYADLPYANFPGDRRISIRVVNADGTGVRVLVDSVCGVYPAIGGPRWSPGGTHIAFSCRGLEPGIWVIGADGSGLTEVIPDGRNPYWSPDGSRIAFEAGRRVLGIADSDGTNVQTFGAARAGPWNPLTVSPAGKGNPTGSGLAAPWVYAIALVVLVGVVIGGLRARGNIAAKREDQSNDVAS